VTRQFTTLVEGKKPRKQSGPLTKEDDMLTTAKNLTPANVLKNFGRVKEAFEKIDSERKLQAYKIRNFTPNIEFQFERSHYIVKTATSGAELEECLKLRYNVFHREYMNKTRTHGVDIDKLDTVCDHLIIFDKRSEKIIGTYRMNCSKFTDVFYSANEFNMDAVLAMPGTKLELGRACIDKDHRNGVIIALLWRGIAEYIQRTGTEVLFGCGSIKTMDPLEVGLITKHLADQGHLTREYGVSPTKKFTMKQLGKVLEYVEANPYVYNKEEVSKMVPALVQSYFKAGAKVAGEPAIDREFHCIDFLTVLKISDMSAAFKGKYNL
jgi:putative hemolysin